MQKKKIVKTVSILLGITLVLIGTFTFLHWNHHYNKNTLFRKYIAENNKEVYVLGTIGKKHFNKIKHYSMDNMLSVIENLNPDIAMIQARSDHYFRDGIFDGNIDACVAYAYCAENHISTALVDWWIIDNIYPDEATTNLRDDNIFIKVTRTIKEAPANSTLLLVLDSSNFYEQIDRFNIYGYKQVPIENKEDYFHGNEAKFKFPAVVAKTWRDRTYFYAYNFPTEIKNTKGLRQDIIDKFQDKDHDKFYLEEIQYCKYLNNDILFKY